MTKQAERSEARWSVMIPTYNCANYLRSTLESVLIQDLGPDQMQIEVIDDCSTRDDPEEVVMQVGGGRVGFWRQQTNVGHVRNFNTCIKRSRGQLVHILHGDDCVRPGFYQTMERPFQEGVNVDAAFCRFMSMDEEGQWQSIWPLEQPQPGILSDWLAKIATGQRLQTPCMVVRREVYERVGGFDTRLRRYGEDWEMWVRIAAQGAVWYEPEPLALYRVHSSSLTGQSVLNGENGSDIHRAMAIIGSYLPPERARECLSRARENNALAALRRAHRLIDKGSLDGALAQVRVAISFSRSFNISTRATYVLLRLATSIIQEASLVRLVKH